MSNILKQAIAKSGVGTIENLKKADEFMSKHYSRFKLVLSRKKAASLSQGIQLAKNSINNKHADFSNFPESVQLLRLRRLNQTIHSVVNGDAPIHIKCLKLQDASKKFHQTFNSDIPKEQNKKEMEFARASMVMADIESSATTENLTKFALGIKL